MIRIATKSSRAKWVGPIWSVSKDWSEEVDALMDEEWRIDDEKAKTKTEHSYPSKHLKSMAFIERRSRLTVWIDKLFDQYPALQNEPTAVKLATHSALASAKLAAALSDDDVDEIGMTIAYLKRALKGDHRIDGGFRPVAFRKTGRGCPVCGSAAATFPSARWHHHPDGRISRRMATPLRLRRLSGLNEIAVGSVQLCKRKRLRLNPMCQNWTWSGDAKPADSDAFDELVTRYRTRIFAMIYNMVHNEQDAWDLAQESFLKAWRSIKRFRGKSSFYTWMYRIVMNVTIDWLRKKQIKGERSGV